MFGAVKQVWNDDIVQVRVQYEGKKVIAIGYKDNEPFIFEVAEHEDLDNIKIHLLDWLRSHILDCGGNGPG